MVLIASIPGHFQSRHIKCHLTMKNKILHGLVDIPSEKYLTSASTITRCAFKVLPMVPTVFTNGSSGTNYITHGSIGTNKALLVYHWYNW